MIFTIIVNNYQLGTKVKLTPTEKLIMKHKIDRNHIRLVYKEITEKEKENIENTLNKKGKIIYLNK